MAADPSLAGHPVVAGLLTAVERELIDRLRVLEARVAAQDEELADLRRQLGRHSGNSGQPPSQDGPAAARAAGGWPAGPCGHNPGPSDIDAGRCGH